MPAVLLLDAAIAFIKRYKALALAIPLLFALALSHCSDKRHTRQRDEARAENVALIEAAKKNAAAALAQNRAWEAKSAQIAKDAENDHAKALADARDAVARYAATHRVRVVQGGICAAPAASERDDPGQRVEVPADPGMVEVSRTDLQALVDWLVYGVSEHNRSVEKVRAGQAVVGE